MKNIIIFLLIIILSSCQGQNKKDSIMTEKIDFTILEKKATKTPISLTQFTYELDEVLSDGTRINIDGDKNEGFVKKEIPPSPSFLKIYKEFYPNGNLKSKETYIGENVKTGISSYYNENGNLEKYVNEELKFGKIKPRQVLEFLQQKGYINLKTGEGRMDEDGRPVFKLYFTDDNGKKYWIISIMKGKPNDDPKNFPDIGEPPAYLSLDYEMDGETGKVTEVE